MILKTKVGEHVDIRTIAKQVIIEKDGIAKAADFVQAGIHAADVVNMCNAGYLDRIRHGYYQLAEADTTHCSVDSKGNYLCGIGSFSLWL